MMQLFNFWLHRSSQVKWVLADQVLVSGMNFLTGVLLARFLGVDNYGQFVVLYAILLYVNIFQSALIVAPMLSIAPQMNSEAERINYFKGAITLQVLFSLIVSIVIFVLGSGIERWYPLWNTKNSLLPLATSILLFQLQEWLRRYYFICRKGKNVFINDLVSYGGQIILLFLLNESGNLSITNAFWAIAVSSATAFLIGLLTEDILPVPRYAVPVFKRSWKFGRDLLFSGQIYWASSQGILILSAAILGSKTAGGIRAAQNIVGPVNILFQGMENIIPIQAAQRYTQNQLSGLTNYLKKVGLLGGLLLALPCITVSIFSRQLIEIAYGKTYTAYASLIVWQATIALIGFLRMQAFYFFRTTGYTKEIVLNTVISCIIVYIITSICMYQLQETGIMLALMVGEAVGLIAALWAVRRYCERLRASVISPK